MHTAPAFSEVARLLEWRYDQLRRAGYPQTAALVLAESRDVDLHEACDLLRRGATVEEAVAILT
jgi:hypothetical protein